MAVLELTARFVDSVRVEGQLRREYFDVQVRGLGLRVTATGSKSWSFLYTLNGNKKRYTIGRYPVLTLAEARDRARLLLHELHIGNDPVLIKAASSKGMSAEELVELYIDRYAKRYKKSWARDEYLLRKEFLPAFKQRVVRGIKRHEIINFIERIVLRGAPIQANRIFEIVRRMFNFAVEQDCIDSSPCFRVKKPSKEKCRSRVLNPQEISQLWHSTNAKEVTAYLIFKVMLLTGQRRGEVCTIEWQDLDLQSGWWTIPAEKTKNGLSNRVPLTSRLIEIFDRIPKNATWVFPNPTRTGAVKWVNKAIYRSPDLRRIGFVPHDIRRTVATILASLGCSRVVIKRILNHKDNDVTAIYDRYSYDQEARDALEKLDRQIEILVRRIQSPGFSLLTSA